ncbi:hypothetical protein [Acinetobacter modestus]|uniref:hypothetical protein n=1 Tax=Acinetobacter modestus TaxID=1776740 RepID=UPI0030194632
MKIVIILLVCLTTLANAKIVPKTTLDVVDTAVCTAAAMKSQRYNVYDVWVTELKNRYTLIFPNKSKNELDEYTSERVLDKKRWLERKGYSTKPAFLKFYDMNCKDYVPK